MRRQNVIHASTAAEAKKKAVDYAVRVYKREGKMINANTVAMQAKVYYNNWAESTGHATTRKLKPFMNIAQKMNIRCANISDMGGRKKKRGKTMTRKRNQAANGTKKKAANGTKKKAANGKKKTTAMVKAKNGTKAVAARKTNPKKKAAKRKTNALLGKRKRKSNLRKANADSTLAMFGKVLLGSAKYAVLGVAGWSLPGVSLALGESTYKKISTNATYQKAIPPINSGIALLISGLSGYYGGRRIKSRKSRETFNDIVSPMILGTGARFMVDLAQAILPYDTAPSTAPFFSKTTLRTIMGLPTTEIAGVSVAVQPQLSVAVQPQPGQAVFASAADKAAYAKKVAEKEAKGPGEVTSSATLLLQGGNLHPHPTMEVGIKFGPKKVAAWQATQQVFMDPATQADMKTVSGTYVEAPEGYVIAVEPDIADPTTVYPLVDKNGVAWMMYGDRAELITLGHEADTIMMEGYEQWSPQMGTWDPAMTDQIQGYEQWSPQMGAFDVGYQKPMGAFDVGYQKPGVQGYESWSPDLGDFEIGYQMGGDNPFGDPF